MVCQNERNTPPNLSGLQISKVKVFWGGDRNGNGAYEGMVAVVALLSQEVKWLKGISL